MEKKPIFRDLKMVMNEDLIQRNYMCPEYDGCLAYAAYADFDLVCRACPFKEDKQVEFLITEMEMIGCNCLLHAVFGSPIN